MIELKNLTAGYKGQAIVTNISFIAYPNELTGLLGVNGAGKTTLLKTMSGLIPPIHGKCFISGKNIYHMSEKQRSQCLSFMPQRSSIIYDIPVIDVVLMGITPHLRFLETPSKKHRLLALHVLAQFNLSAFAHRSFLTLSEGQKQLVVIARNLLQNASVMLFDEPDSALDFKNRHWILNHIRELIVKSNRSGLITLHNPNDALNYCHRIIILNEGKIFHSFQPHIISVEELKETFTAIYGKITVIKHQGQWMIGRLFDESRV